MINFNSSSEVDTDVSDCLWDSDDDILKDLNYSFTKKEPSLTSPIDLPTWNTPTPQDTYPTKTDYLDTYQPDPYDYSHLKTPQGSGKEKPNAPPSTDYYPQKITEYNKYDTPQYDYNAYSSQGNIQPQQSYPPSSVNPLAMRRYSSMSTEANLSVSNTPLMSPIYSSNVPYVNGMNTINTVNAMGGGGMNGMVYNAAGGVAVGHIKPAYGQASYNAPAGHSMMHGMYSSGGGMQGHHAIMPKSHGMGRPKVMSQSHKPQGKLRTARQASLVLDFARDLLTLRVSDYPEELDSMVRMNDYKEKDRNGDLSPIGEGTDYFPTFTENSLGHNDYTRLLVFPHSFANAALALMQHPTKGIKKH